MNVNFRFCEIKEETLDYFVNQVILFNDVCFSDLKVVAANQFDISVPFFRGCIFTAIFNGVDVLHPLHSITNEKVVYNIKAGKLKYAIIAYLR